MFDIFNRRAAIADAARPAEPRATVRGDDDGYEARQLREIDQAERRRSSLCQKIKAACSWDAEAGAFTLIVANRHVGRLDRIAVWVVLENVVIMRPVREFEREIASLQGGDCYVETIRPEPGEDFGPEPAAFAVVLTVE